MSANLSLLDLFSPPRAGSADKSAWHGVKGLLCGYSADAAFMQTALLHFTECDESLRRKSGRLFLTLAIDTHEDIGPDGEGQSKADQLRNLSQVAGLEIAGCQPGENSRLNRFSLHAKVAVLRFERANQWCLRLIVSTGNWTRATARDSIDLFWSCDLYSDELQGNDQAIADLLAARHFFEKLSVDYPLLSQQGLATAVTIENTFFGLPDMLRGGRKKAKPRFMDSFDEPLWTQIRRRARKFLSGKEPNYLLYLGSGFYQQDYGRDRTVVDRILKDLTSSANRSAVLVMNSKRYLHLYVNSSTAGVIGTDPDNWATDWKLYGPQDPMDSRNKRQTLHASSAQNSQADDPRFRRLGSTWGLEISLPGD